MSLLRRLTARAIAREPAAKPDSAPVFQGYVDERSSHHVAGWVWNLADRGARVPVEILLGPSGEMIATAVADRRSPILRAIGIGDAAHAFEVILPRQLTADEQSALVVRPIGGAALELAPALRVAWEPIRYVAMDIVNNCNLRCPFCVYDYASVNRTSVMPAAIFQSALRLLPYTTEQNFWLSCLHEPSMHPNFAEFVEQIPVEQKTKTFFTTNLAKRMPPAYFAGLARSHLSNVNISIESLEPAVYERMRKGARQSVFLANLDQLISAFAAAPSPPRLRYNILAFRSNLDEIPALVGHLLGARMADQVEIRHPYAMSHIPEAFTAAEFLPDDAWAPLAEALAAHGPARVIIVPPPTATIAARPARAEGRPPLPRLEIQMNWEGMMAIRHSLEDDQDHTGETRTDFVAHAKISDIADIAAFLADLQQADRTPS